MRKNSEGEIRVRCAEAERGFLAGVKEMVKMRAEMGVMPWGSMYFIKDVAQGEAAEGE